MMAALVLSVLCLTGTAFATASDSPATRAEAAAALWEAAGCPVVVNYAMAFGDVPQDAFYTEAVRWCAAEGYMQGYDGKTFGPADPITRQQLAAVLYRYVQRQGGGFVGMWMFPLRYTDVAQVREWAYEPLCWMTMKGVLAGNSDGALCPNGTVARGELAGLVSAALATAE
ncbi:MAG: S-layer homology domain-containing protein [Oscillibacter sp.]|nr:S-layer homology domain-containing protein [Oscillibacter sp.]